MNILCSRIKNLEQWVSFGDQIRKLQEQLKFTEDSKIFQGPDSPSSFDTAHVSHQALIPSSCKKPSRESRMQRNTLEDISIPRSVFDCQLARRVPEELHNNSRNLTASSGIQRREGIEKSGCEKSLQPTPSPCFSGKAKGKKSCLKSVTNHAAGIGTCTQSGRRCIWKFPDHAEFQSWITNFRTKVCSKAKNPTRVLQWIKEIEAAKSAGRPQHSKIENGQRCHWLWRIGFDDDVSIGEVPREAKHTSGKKISVEEQRAQKDNRFLRGRQIAHLIYEYVRPTGSDDEIQGLSGFIRIKLDNDKIQDFAERWEQALSDKVLKVAWFFPSSDNYTAI